jgi:hypothetical protein
MCIAKTHAFLIHAESPEVLPASVMDSLIIIFERGDCCPKQALPRSLNIHNRVSLLPGCTEQPWILL